MSAISLKSITGITSITTPAGVDNVFTVHTNDTTERFRVDQTGNLNIAGIVTVTKDLDVDGHTNLDNVSIAGVTTLTDRIFAGGTSIPGYTGADDLTIGSESGNHGITIRTGTTNTGGLFFSDATSAGDNSTQWAGGIEYNHGSGELRFYQGETVRGMFKDGHFLPWQDSQYSLGSSSKRWSNLHVDGATIAGNTTITGDLDVDRHTNLDNVSIVGIASITNVDALRLNSATGTYQTFQYNGAARGYTGTANHLYTGGSTGDFGLAGGASANIVFATSNDERLRITSAGRVGINETSPDSLLHVRNDNSYAAKFGGEAGGSEYYMEIGQLATNGSAGFNATGTAGSMLFKINGSEKLRIDPDGDLGLGDTNPNIRLTVVDSGTDNLVRLGRSDASGHASHTVNVKASKDFYHHFKMEASSFNLDTYNGSAMIEAFKVHNTGYAELAGAADIRLTLGNYGTAGSNGANWVRGTNSNLYYNAGAGIHLWEIAGAEHMRLSSSGNLFLRSESANYVVMGSSGDATSGGVTNNMNWIRGNGTNTQYNSAGGFHAWEVSGSQKMVLSAGGDLGLNATNPGSRLSIYDADGHNLTLSSHNWSGEARIGFTGGSSTGTGYSNGGTAGAIGVTASAPGGQAVGYMSFYTNQGDSLMEYLRLDKDGHLQLRQDTGDGSSQQKLQWISNNGTLSSQIAWGQGSANFDFSVFRSDSQANSPYGNFRVLTGSNSSPTEAMKITVRGEVLKARNPAFSASDSAGHVYGGNPPPTMVFNSVDFNIGNNYNSSNGIFTAPIAGKYQFSFGGMAAGGTGDFQVRILKNGGGYFNNNGSGRGYGTFEPYGFTVLMDLAINETVEIKIYSSNTSCYIYAGSVWNKFSGYLIG